MFWCFWFYDDKLSGDHGPRSPRHPVASKVVAADNGFEHHPVRILFRVVDALVESWVVAVRVVVEESLVVVHVQDTHARVRVCTLSPAIIRLAVLARWGTSVQRQRWARLAGWGTECRSSRTPLGGHSVSGW